jgi:seryl-tRNA synthetase
VIDLRTLRDDPERLRVSQRARGEDDTVVERLLDLDERRRSALSSFESLRAEQKSFGRSVSKAQGDERQKLLDRAKELAQQVKEADAEAQRLDQELTDLLRTVPNIVEEGAPAGGEEDYVVLETVGSPPTFAFEPKDHLSSARRSARSTPSAAPRSPAHGSST